MKAVLFDLDGTLVHSAPDIRLATNALFAEYDLPPVDLQTIVQAMGGGGKVLIERCFQAAGRSAGDLEAALARFLHFYDATGHRLTKPYPGVVAMLEGLAARGNLMGVCTNKQEGRARAVLAACGLTPFFVDIVGGDTLPVKKPDPAPLALCAERCGVALAACVFVGDSETDAETARAAGVPFLFYPHGYRRQPPERMEIAVTIPDFNDFAALTADLLAEAA